MVYFSPSVLSIIAGGKHRRFYATDAGAETLREIYNIAKRFKESGSEKDGKALAKYMDPDFRQDIDSLLCEDIKGNVYLKDLPHHKLPVAIVDMLDVYKEEGIDHAPIINLWKLALDNPNSTAREGLMDYIEKFGVPVTDNGYMILYKSVRDKNAVIEKLAYVVGEAFFELKKNRKTPTDYWVYELPDNAVNKEGVPRFFVENTTDVVCEVHRKVPESSMYEVWWTVSPDEEDAEPDATAATYGEAMEALKELGGSEYDSDAIVQAGQQETINLEPIGNLAKLFTELVIDKQDLEPDERDKEPVWEPYHSGSYGMEIRLGEPVTMPRDECDPDIRRECSYGLHVGSYEYVHRFHPQDGTVLACLVNPRDIVALPEYDNSKIRTCAYMPYGIIGQDEEGNWEEVTSAYWEEDFLDYEVQKLEERIENLKSQAESQEIPQESLQEMIKFAEKRLVKLKQD